MCRTVCRFPLARSLFGVVVWRERATVSWSVTVARSGVTPQPSRDVCLMLAVPVLLGSLSLPMLVCQCVGIVCQCRCWCACAS